MCVYACVCVCERERERERVSERVRERKERERERERAHTVVVVHCLSLSNCAPTYEYTAIPPVLGAVPCRGWMEANEGEEREGAHREDFFWWW